MKLCESCGADIPDNDAVSWSDGSYTCRNEMASMTCEYSFESDPRFPCYSPNLIESEIL